MAAMPACWSAFSFIYSMGYCFCTNISESSFCRGTTALGCSDGSGNKLNTGSEAIAAEYPGSLDAGATRESVSPGEPVRAHEFDVLMEARVPEGCSVESVLVVLVSVALAR